MHINITRNDSIFVCLNMRDQEKFKCSRTVSRFPLHDSVWLVLLDQTKNANPKVFQSVALALYYLAVDSGTSLSLSLSLSLSHCPYSCIL